MLYVLCYQVYYNNFEKKNKNNYKQLHRIGYKLFHMLFICNTYYCNMNTTIKSLKIKVIYAFFPRLGLQSGDDCNLKLNEANYLTLKWNLLKSTKTSTNKVTFSLIILKLVVKFTHSLCPFPP